MHKGSRALLAVVRQDSLWVFVTSDGFIRDAWEFGRLRNRRKIILLDGQALVGLWIE